MNSSDPRTVTMKAGIVFALVAAVGIAVYARRAPASAKAASHVAAQEASAGAVDAKSAGPLPRLVDVGAGKCIPCKMMAPVLEELKTEYAGRMDVQFVDVWENPEAGRPYGVSVIPTQIFYDAAGKELLRHEGFFSKEDILAKWKEAGVNLGG